MVYSDLKDLFIKASYLKPKPQLLFRIMNNYFNLLCLNKKVLRYINIWATWKCQCHCAYCSNLDSRQSIKDKKMMSLADFEKVFNSVRKLGAININFIGGEPLVSNELFDLIKLTKTKSMMVSITTNGILLKNKAQALYKAGLDFVNISIDSPYDNVHDRSKGFPGAFDAAIDGIKAARASKLRAIIAMVVNHQNLNNGEVEEMIILAKRLKVDLQLLPVIALGHFKSQFNMRLDNKDMKKFYDLTSSHNVRWDGRTNYLRKGCPAGLEKLTIDIFGDVYPCSLIPIKVGNIFEQRLEDIFHKTIKSEAFKEWSPVCRAAFNDEFIKKYMPI